jgi:phosphate:Na+ symporter
MIKKIVFISFLAILAVILFFNPNLKTIAAGVAVLLFGMGMLEEGFKVFTKGPLQNILKKSTDKLYKSITAGAVVTALIQSSSLVSVITISFISAGLLSLSGGLGLMFGANIGSTATAWLVAGFGLKIDISALAMPMIIFGLIFTFQKKDSLKGTGNVLAGLGFFFLGIYFMKAGFDVFSTHINLTEYAVSGFKGVLIYTGIGIIITVVLQSSAASLVLVLTALAAGQIEYENALALAIGANIGTTITAVLGALNSNIAGKRLAAAHLIFNVLTGAVALALIYPLAQLVNNIAGFINIDQTDYTLKLALFHTIFNVLGVIIMVPFIKKLEIFLLRIFKENKYKYVDEPKYLNEAILKFPSTLISSLLKESKDLYKNTIFEIVAHSLNIHRNSITSNEKIKKIVQNSNEQMNVDIDQLYYNKVKNIYGQIISFAAKGQENLKFTNPQNKQLSQIKVANRIMVKIIKDTKDLSRNVAIFSNSDNVHIKKEYDKFRKKVVKVLRVIYLFRTNEEKEQHYEQLLKLKKSAKKAINSDNKSINKLIRKNLITIDMASSLVNDNVNVNDLVGNLIQVAELLYSEKDAILDNDNK